MVAQLGRNCLHFKPTHLVYCNLLSDQSAISIKPITYASTGITLSLFTAIVLYHIVTKVLSTEQGQLTMRKLKHHFLKFRKNKQAIQSGHKMDLTGSNSKFKDKVTYSVIQLEETLI